MNLSSIGGLGGILALGGGITFITTGWSHVKSFLVRIRRYIIIEVEIGDRKSIYGLRSFLSKEFKVTSGEPYLFNRISCFRKSDGNKSFPLVRKLPENGMLRKGWKYIYLSNNDDYESRYYMPKPKISFLRWTFDIRYFADMASKYSPSSDLEDKEITKRFVIEELMGTRFEGDLEKIKSAKKDDKEEGGMSNNHDGVSCSKINEVILFDGKEDDYIAKITQKDGVYQVPENCEIIIDEIDKWHSHGKWYKERGIPWKRGILLHSAPGQGKTSFVRFIAKKLNMPIYSVDLSSMTNGDLVKNWNEKISQNTPCVVLIEDIDSVFHGRENITNSASQKAGVSFDCLLRCIDGISINDGILLFLTTNDIDKVDCALSCTSENGEESRPGRIDRTVFIDSPSLLAKENIAKRILDNNLEIVKEIVELGKNDTGAQFQERCTRMALSMFNKKKIKNDN